MKPDSTIPSCRLLKVITHSFLHSEPAEGGFLLLFIITGEMDATDVSSPTLLPT